MKNTLSTIAALLLLFTQGCASMMSHGFVPADSVDPQKGKVTPIFPGTVADIGGVGVALASPFIPSRVEHRPPRWFILATPFIILDLPFSLVADLIFLPSDIRTIPEWRRYHGHANDVGEKSWEEFDKAMKDGRNH